MSVTTTVRLLQQCFNVSYNSPLQGFKSISGCHGRSLWITVGVLLMMLWGVSTARSLVWSMVVDGTGVKIMTVICCQLLLNLNLFIRVSSIVPFTLINAHASVQIRACNNRMHARERTA